jgi:hypothetical protein
VLALMAGAFPAASVTELESAFLQGRVDALSTFNLLSDARDLVNLTLKR